MGGVRIEFLASGVVVRVDEERFSDSMSRTFGEFGDPGSFAFDLPRDFSTPQMGSNERLRVTLSDGEVLMGQGFVQRIERQATATRVTVRASGLWTRTK